MANTLENMQNMLIDSPGAWRLLEAQAGRDFPFGAGAATRRRFEALFESLPDIVSALDRAAGLDSRQIAELIAGDAKNWAEEDRQEKKMTTKREANDGF